MAGNDITGEVSEIHTRSGNSSDDHSVYFRLKVNKDVSRFASCLTESTSITWHLDPNSPVFEQQYNAIMRSYTEQLPIRVTGQSNVCETTYPDSDKVFELSPSSWGYWLAEKARNNSEK